ncbi:MAG: hypothetical protein N3E50_03925 [Candidatus Goldbacteria bacterium]|nr:hypothetical protein [Candidatus Goldiibacteriota bacterium]
MKSEKTIKILMICFLCFMFSISVNASVSVGMTVTDEGLKSFYFSIGQFYRVPEKEVVIIREQGIPDDELPVVFFLAMKSGVPYGQIVRWRVHNRWSWMKIVSKLRLSPEIFYVPIDVPIHGGYYGRIYGYYQQPRNKWKYIKLTDSEIIHCVNLHFISGYYGYKPIEVIKMRDAGKNFVIIHNDIKVVKEKTKMKYIKHDKPRKGKGKH